MSTTKYADRTQLTPREAEIQALQNQGLSIAQIAEQLGLAESTIRQLVRSIKMRKMGEKQ